MVICSLRWVLLDLNFAGDHCPHRTKRIGFKFEVDSPVLQLCLHLCQVLPTPLPISKGVSKLSEHQTGPGHAQTSQWCSVKFADQATDSQRS